MNDTEIDPSPTADATRLMDSCLASPSPPKGIENTSRVGGDISR